LARSMFAVPRPVHGTFRRQAHVFLGGMTDSG
jgi:hypothetical protein